MVSCSSHCRVTCPGKGDLENAQTTVTVESTLHASHHKFTTIVMSDNAVQQYTCPGLPGFSQSVTKTRAVARLVRSPGRRDARLRSAPYWAGSVQCAAVRQIKPNHESCDKYITLHNLGFHKRNMVSYTHHTHFKYLQWNPSHLCVCPFGKVQSHSWKGSQTSFTRPRRPVQSSYQHRPNASSKSLC